MANTTDGRSLKKLIFSVVLSAAGEDGSITL